MDKNTFFRKWSSSRLSRGRHLGRTTKNKRRHQMTITATFAIGEVQTSPKRAKSAPCRSEGKPIVWTSVSVRGRTSIGAKLPQRVASGNDLPEAQAGLAQCSLLGRSRKEDPEAQDFGRLQVPGPRRGPAGLDHGQASAGWSSRSATCR